MKKPLSVVLKNKKYSLSSDFVREKKFLKYDNWYHSGFDKSPETSLYVECVKVKNVNYSYEKEYDYNKRNRFESKKDQLKLFFIKNITKFIDFLFSTFVRIRNLFTF